MDSKDIKWMYEGPKSLVNREDYLLGKKVCFFYYNNININLNNCNKLFKLNY